MILFHKIHGKDFLVEVANSPPLSGLNSQGEQLGELMGDNLENEDKSWEAKEEKPDTFEEELQKLKLRNGNDYMSNSMAKEGRCEGDANMCSRVCLTIKCQKFTEVFIGKPLRSAN